MIISFSLAKAKDKDKMFSSVLDSNFYDWKSEWRRPSNYRSLILALIKFLLTRLSPDNSNFAATNSEVTLLVEQDSYENCCEYEI